MSDHTDAGGGLTEVDREALLSLAYAYAHPGNDDDPRAEWTALEGYVHDLVQQARAEVEAERDKAWAACDEWRDAAREAARRAEAAEAEVSALRERLARAEAVLSDSTSGGYWTDGADGWVRGVREDSIRAALAPQEARPCVHCGQHRDQHSMDGVIEGAEPVCVRAGYYGNRFVPQEGPREQDDHMCSGLSCAICAGLAGGPR